MGEATSNNQNLIKALIKAQGEIKNVAKDKVNPFFHSKYAPLDSVWDAIKGPLHKHGLCISQATDIINNQAVLVTLLLHESGEFIRSVYPLNPVKNDPQGLGASITYARRFSLAALVGLVSEEDDDGSVASSQTRQVVSQPVSQPASGSLNDSFVPASFTTKPVMVAGKEKSSYSIKSPEGTYFSTLNDDVGAVLKEAHSDSLEVEITYVKNGKYNNITEAILSRYAEEVGA